MINVLLVLNIIVVILLIGIILLQKSEGGVLGMGGSGSKNGIFTAQSAGNLITKMTYFLGAMFFIICIALAFLVARKNNSSKSFIETMIEKNNVKEVKSTDVNIIPEDKIKEEMAKESVKEEINTKKKPVAPVSK
ncbi:preprotein translocase subunit SecG [bacterium]|nr:preprotein translocase subunit SecG [bacterium]